MNCGQVCITPKLHGCLVKGRSVAKGCRGIMKSEQNYTKMLDSEILFP
jgi:hypothetical protein